MTSGSNVDLGVLDESLQVQNGTLEDRFESELELLLREQRHQSFIEREKEWNMYRSGSAPPTVEGSLNAVGSLFRNYDFSNSNVNNSNNNGGSSEDHIRSDPAYLSYYYSNDNNNPRLPHPYLSKEDWRATQRYQANGSQFGGIGDRRKRFVDDGNCSLFCVQPGVSVQQQENFCTDLSYSSGRNFSSSGDRSSDRPNSISSNDLGGRRKSFADILQEGLDRPGSVSCQPSRPSSRNAFGESVGAVDSKMPGLSNVVGSELQEGAAAYSLLGLQSHGRPVSHSFAASVGSSLSRSTTPEAQLIGRAPSPSLPPVGSRIFPVEKKNNSSNIQNGYSSYIDQPDITANLAGLSLSNIRHEESRVQSQLELDVNNQSDYLFNLPNGGGLSLQQQLTNDSIDKSVPFPSDYVDLARKNGILRNLNASSLLSNERVNFPRRTSSSANLYSNVGSSGFGYLEGPNIHLQNADSINIGSGSSTINRKLNTVMNNYIDAGCALDGSGNTQSLGALRNHRHGLQSPFIEPSYAKLLPGSSEYVTYCRSSPGDISQVRDSIGTSQGNLDAFQKAYLESLLAEQKQQYELSLLGESSGYNRRHFGNPSSGISIPYMGDLMASARLSSIGSGSSMLQNERISRYNSMTRNFMGESIGLWPSDIGNLMEGRLGSSLLDEFKSNKSRSFELSDIIDHVVEFSMDQYGSRFIQQKLETAKLEEQNEIFSEIIPHARALMTDVFGNYVIQKLFEHGTESQRKELASQLTGHVLPLSLQMYGCRVIQKALEVVDADQQTHMVAELDGAVMKCVRDQNGNHVIQKCIECVPQDRIQFIISAFYGQVVSLSTHPYGCRVIQRVLEHCDDLNTLRIVMDEIMQSVCSLSQDQYGNYVIQHVLEHGLPHERSVIITKLAGQIVKMSQQKFASNVVEKCLTFGSHEERQLLVDEMLGSTDENEPLQAMMKDPFGNYVVQKVLETCDPQNLELILSRIRVHLNALKRYTYGKHIVSRVEKLIATGEKRIGMTFSASSQQQA